MPRKVTGPQSASSTPEPRAATEPPRAQLSVLEHGVVRERADAARNRRRVLAAAERLFAAHGVSAVTMDDVAAEAGVGKGTLYRRFGDKGGLAVALLDQRERELQHELLSGAPPLGPGAAPAARLSAFVTAYVALVAAQLDLMLMSETSAPGARLRTGAHAFWRRHCEYLLSEAGAADPVVRAEVILAGLAAEQVQHWVRSDDSLDAVADGLAAAARTLAATGRA